jgi:hypothetical protein
MNGEKKATSPWVYVGIGCVVLLFLGVVAVAAIGYGAFRWGKQVEKDLKDPATRTAKVKAVLGADTLPEGYHPMIGLSIPLLMDMAMLSDREPGPDGQAHGPGQRGFIYVRVLSADSNEKELRDYFDGKTNDDSVLRRNKVNIHVRDQEVIRRGVVETNGYPVMYLAQRGDLQMNETRSQGVHSLLLVDCPQDERMRMGIWFGPDPDAQAPVATADFQGTPADVNALTAFLGHFHLCREAR